MKLDKLAPKIIYSSTKKRRKSWPDDKYITRFDNLPQEDIHSDDWEIIEEIKRDL